MILKNALVFTENGFVKGDIAMAEGHFIQCPSGDGLDAQGLYAIPGLIDIHMHGCVRHDFSDGTVEEMYTMAQYQAINGITALCPATMTLPQDHLETACRNMAALKGDDAAEIVGINLEGPFLSSQNIGAQNPKYLRNPDLGFVRRLQEASGGLVKLISIAPEVEGAIDLIKTLSKEVTCSLAHTTADYDTAIKAFASGARHVTHLFNAMPPLHHRSPGVIGAAFDTPNCNVELICDGVHLHPSIVRVAMQLFGEDRVLFISDSMMATGLSDGEYSLGGQGVKVQGNTAKLSHQNTIAGSVTNLMNCVRYAVGNMKIPLYTAVKCASVNPAKAIGVFDKRGSIAPGKVADLVLLDENLTIKQVFLRGTALL